MCKGNTRFPDLPIYGLSSDLCGPAGSSGIPMCSGKKVEDAGFGAQTSGFSSGQHRMTHRDPALSLPGAPCTA